MTRLRTALRDREVSTVALLLATVPVGIAVSDDFPVLAGERRVLPAYLSSVSFEADAPAGELMLLLPKELLALLQRLDVEGVRFDPALPNPVTVPSHIVQELLGGGPDGDGGRAD